MNTLPPQRSLLHVIASPRAMSKSRAAANAYIGERCRLDSQLRVDELDLWATDLPEMSGETLSAKYAVLARAAHDPAQQQSWERVTAIARTFAEYDEYAFSVPMWNFGLPYRLKHYIDIVTQPGLTFSWTPERGYQGLLHGRRTFVAYASSFDYSQGSALAALDTQKTSFAGWLRLVGLENVRQVDCGPTSATIAASATAQERAHAQARSSAGS